MSTWQEVYHPVFKEPERIIPCFVKTFNVLATEEFSRLISKARVFNPDPTIFKINLLIALTTPKSGNNLKNKHKCGYTNGLTKTVTKNLLINDNPKWPVQFVSKSCKNDSISEDVFKKIVYQFRFVLFVGILKVSSVKSNTALQK